MRSSSTSGAQWRRTCPRRSARSAPCTARSGRPWRPARSTNSRRASRRTSRRCSGDKGEGPVTTQRRDKDALLARATKPSEDALRLHLFYRGKMQTALKCPVRDFGDFAIWYTPGVAAPCRAIQADPELVYAHTNKANTIAIVTDGTRVLGLGDIGPEAGLPVMEGKALLFKYLGGVDAVPICLKTKDPDELVRAVELLEPAFGAINLEDIAQPKCFRILDTLRARLSIPVWHDDQQGSAPALLPRPLNAPPILGQDPRPLKVPLV